MLHHFIHVHFYELFLRPSLQQALTLLQQRQLDRLADWLDQMESYIHNLGSVQGAGDGSIHQQIEAHKVSLGRVLCFRFSNSIVFQRFLLKLLW